MSFSRPEDIYKIEGWSEWGGRGGTEIEEVSWLSERETLLAKLHVLVSDVGDVKMNDGL